jgi:hypothetical protein
MSTTPNYNWPLIEPTDFVTNLPADLETLADDIDSTVYGIDQAALKATLVDAKGDLLAGTAADTIARLGVGANGTVLTADSSQSTGLIWGAPPATGDNWTLLNTGGTDLTGALTITVSGISNKEKLFIGVYGFSGTANAMTMRFNTDSGSEYQVWRATVTGNSSYSSANYSNQGTGTFATSIPFSQAGGSTASMSGYLLMTGCNSTNPKVFNYVAANNNGGDNGQRHDYGGGVYTGTSAISSVSIITNTNNWAGGKIFVYAS